MQNIKKYIYIYTHIVAYSLLQAHKTILLLLLLLLIIIITVYDSGGQTGCGLHGDNPVFFTPLLINSSIQYSCPLLNKTLLSCFCISMTSKLGQKT